MVYGFGSYFCDLPEYHDVDILIVHRSCSAESCQFSIQCKQFFVLNISRADVTILSTDEEQQLSFVARSRACYIGQVDSLRKESDLTTILSRVGEYRNQGIAERQSDRKT